MLWLNLCLLLLFQRLAPAGAGLRKDSCSGRLPVVMVARWNGSGSVTTTPPRPHVPDANVTNPGDTGNANESQANCSQRWSNTCSARKATLRLFVDGRKQNRRTFNNYLIRPPLYGWFRGSCNCFRRVLVCKLLTEKPKKSCNRSLAPNLSQPPNPRPTRPLRFYSSPVATGLSLYETQSLQLPE